MKYQNEFYNKILFSMDDVKELFSTESTKYCSLSSYVKRGKLARIRSGLYGAINPMTREIYATKFEIATKIVQSGYVSYHSALEYHGLHTQVFNTVYVASDKRFIEFDYDGVNYQRIVSKFQDGVIEKMQDIKVRVTDVERTIIDCINRIDLAGGIEELLSAIENVAYLDERKLLKYLDLYNLKYVYKKAGFLFSKAKGEELSNEFYLHCKQKIGTGRSYLVENHEIKSKIDNDWQLIVPKELLIKDEVTKG